MLQIFFIKKTFNKTILFFYSYHIPYLLAIVMKMVVCIKLPRVDMGKTFLEALNFETERET